MIIDRCTGLNSLEFIMEMASVIFTDSMDFQEMSTFNLSTLRKFTFQAGDVGYCNRNVFQMLTNVMPNVDDVDISINVNSVEILPECQHVVEEFIKRQATKLKSLNLYGWEVPALYSFLMTPNLNLNKLSMEICSTAQLDNVRKMSEVFVKQSYLKHLSLIRWQFDVELVKKLFLNLKWLKTFSLTGCVIEQGWLKHINYLNNLENLELVFCSSTTFDEITPAFLAKGTPSLKSIKLKGYLGESKSFFDGLRNVKNLKSLQIESHSKCGLDDEKFQKIIVNLKKLTYLRVFPYENLTDAAVVNDDPNKCLSSLEWLEYLELPIPTTKSGKFSTFDFSNAAVNEILKLRHLKVVKLPDSEMVSRKRMIFVIIYHRNTISLFASLDIRTVSAADG